MRQSKCVSTLSAEVSFESLPDIWDSKRKELIRISRETSWKNFGKRIFFYAPSFVPYKSMGFTSKATLFPSISITGRSCALRCEHCSGKLLNTMMTARTPSELIALCERLKKRGCVGCLISGGCLPDGRVPLENFIEAIHHVKHILGLKVTVHTGLLNRATALKLAKTRIDAALIDIIGSDETIRQVYHLGSRVEDYEGALGLLENVGIPTVPHILVGLHYGMLKGEFNALEFISRHNPRALVLIVLTPIKGTGMSNVTPPSPEKVAEVMVNARIKMPHIPIVLGCVRPKGRHRVETDTLAVEAGVNAIAFPTREAIELAESMGLKVHFSPLCCSQIYEEL